MFNISIAQSQAKSTSLKPTPNQNTTETGTAGSGSQERSSPRDALGAHAKDVIPYGPGPASSKATGRGEGKINTQKTKQNKTHASKGPNPPDA